MPSDFREPLAQKRIRERRQIVEVCNVSIICVEIVDPLFADVDVQCRVRIVAPIVGAGLDAVEQTLLRIRIVKSVLSSFGPSPRSTTLR